MKKLLYFSKGLTIFTSATAIVVTALSVILPNLGFNADGFITALPYVWTADGVSIGFYFWKSKNENRHKHTLAFIKELAGEYGIDAALRASEITLKD